MKRGLVTAAVLAALLAGCYVVATPHGLEVGIAPIVPVVVPRMAYIQGTSIQVVSAAGVAGDVFHHGGAYWRWYNGHWWRSGAWNRGWGIVTSVPRAFLSIPSGHRMHRLVRHHPLFKRPTPVKKTRTIRAPVTRTVKPHVVKPRAAKKPVVKKKRAHKTVVVPARAKAEEKKKEKEKKKKRGGSAKSKKKGRVIVR